MTGENNKSPASRPTDWREALVWDAVWVRTYLSFGTKMTDDTRVHASSLAVAEANEALRWWRKVRPLYEIAGDDKAP